MRNNEKIDKKIKKYIEYMHEVLIDLYISQYIDPTKLLVRNEDLRALTERKRFTPLEPSEVAMLILYVTELCGIAEKLVGIIDEANRYLLHKKIYDVTEDWQITGIIDWPRTLRNIITGQSIAQRVLSYTLVSPENILLKLIVDHTLSRLDELTKRLENLKKRIESKISGEIPVGSRVVVSEGAIKALYDKLNKAATSLNEALENSFLGKISRELYAHERFESIQELTREVEVMPWKPEWVEQLLSLVYRYYVDDELWRRGDRLVDAIFDKLVGKKPVNVEAVFKIYSYKLYEIYVLYLVLKALRGLEARINLIEPRKIYARIGDNEI